MMTRGFFLFLLAALFATPFPSHAEDARPSAGELLKRVRHSFTHGGSRLTGLLRDSESGKQEPLELNMSEQAMRFSFTHPSQVVSLDLTTAPATLREIKPGRSAEVPAAMYGERVRGFDLTYEDLSMSFLYWTHAKVLGEESLGVFSGKAWIVQVTAPDSRGPYGTVEIWVHEGSNAMAKMEAFDRKGSLIKRFLIASVQKNEETRIPKEIRVETLAPGDKRTGITYMTFDPPAKH